jgi:hypothetical protein
MVLNHQPVDHYSQFTPTCCQIHMNFLWYPLSACVQLHGGFAAPSSRWSSWSSWTWLVLDDKQVVWGDSVGGKYGDDQWYSMVFNGYLMIQGGAPQ